MITAPTTTSAGHRTPASSAVMGAVCSSAIARVALARRTDERHAAQQLGVIDREAHGDHAARRVSEHVRRDAAGGADDRREIGAEHGERTRLVGGARPSVRSQVTTRYRGASAATSALHVAPEDPRPCVNTTVSGPAPAIS